MTSVTTNRRPYSDMIAPDSMINQKRPVVVSVLAGVAFLASAVLCLGLILSFKGLPIAIREENPSAVFVLVIVEFCFVALAWTFAATCKDLWVLRKRGHTLALIFLFVLGLIGVATSISDHHGLLFLLGLSICGLSIGAIGYLLTPNIRRKFVPEASDSRIPTPPRLRLVIAVTSLASSPRKAPAIKDSKASASLELPMTANRM